MDSKASLEGSELSKQAAAESWAESPTEVQLAAVPISPTRLLRRTGGARATSRWVWLLLSSPTRAAARARGGGLDLVVAEGFSAVGCDGEILLGSSFAGGVVPAPRAGSPSRLRLWACPSFATAPAGAPSCLSAYPIVPPDEAEIPSPLLRLLCVCSLNLPRGRSPEQWGSPRASCGRLCMSWPASAPP